MRKLLSSVLLLWLPYAASAQSLDGNALSEIFSLYREKQYNIVQVKLEHLGFRVTESTPTYTLNGLTHAGVFTMIREKASNVKELRDNGVKDADRFFFSTEIQHVLQEVYISFDYVDNLEVPYVYRYLLNEWADDVQPFEYEACSNGTHCRSFHRQWQTRNQRSAIMQHSIYFDVQFNDKPLVFANNPPAENNVLHGTYIYRLYYPPQKAAARTKVHKK